MKCGSCSNLKASFLLFLPLLPSSLAKTRAHSIGTFLNLSERERERERERAQGEPSSVCWIRLRNPWIHSFSRLQQREREREFEEMPSPWRSSERTIIIKKNKEKRK